MAAAPQGPQITELTDSDSEEGATCTEVVPCSADPNLSVNNGTTTTSLAMAAPELGVKTTVEAFNNKDPGRQFVGAKTLVEAFGVYNGDSGQQKKTVLEGIVECYKDTPNDTKIIAVPIILISLGLLVYGFYLNSFLLLWIVTGAIVIYGINRFSEKEISKVRVNAIKEMNNVKQAAVQRREMESGVLRRNGLGRIHPLGALYDARTDMFTGESILLSRSIPTNEGLMDEKDISFSDISNSISRNLSDRFDQLEIKGELKLSVLCGLVEVKGSVKYLTEESEDKRLLCSSLIYKTKTKQHQLQWSNVNQLRPYLSFDSIENPGYATHFVSEIEWGFNITISAKTKLANKKSKESIDGLGKALFDRLKIVSVDGKVDIAKLAEIKMDDNNFDFRIHGDIDFPPEMTMPGTFEEAIAFMRKAPAMLPKTNEGKGVPLFYTLQPLPKLQKLYQIQATVENIYKAITDEAVTQCFQMFEDYATAKQKITEVERELEENMAFVSPGLLETIRELKRCILHGEAAYKSELMQELTFIRSGEKQPSAVQLFLQEFLQTRKDSPQAVIDGLSVFDQLKEKIALLENLNADGIIYIGAGTSLTMTIMKERKRRTIYVLNYFETMAVKDIDYWKQAIEIFMSLQKQNKDGDALFIFADREINLDQPVNKKAEITISKYTTGRMVEGDLIPEMLENVAKDLACNQHIDATLQRSPTLVTLEIPCPGYFNKRGCSAQKRTFSCMLCKAILQYDFQGYKLTCKCGVFSPITTLFKCTDNAHGDNYETFADDDASNLRSLLEKLQPKEYNILILGETGVGKSTWINGMLNYATYQKLEDALGDPPTKCFIPSRFTIADPKNKTSKSVYLGDPDPNEKDVKGQSATLMPKSYSFVMDGAIFRLIDTPGLGDTRGLDQDKANVDNILRYLGQYKELHGITILMKPNNSRLNVLFDFCLKEFLRHLHKDATNNIMFVFTNARGTFYKPGDTYDALEAVLTTNPSIGIELSDDNIYCMDNEPVRFLAACNYGIQFTDKEKGIFSESWDKAYEETSRLIQHVRSLPPHAADATVTLNEVRRQISALTRPLALITENINHNIQACKDQTKLIEERAMKKKGLEEVLFVPFIDLKQVPLGFPRTVCTASKCMEVRSLHKQNVNHYKTICHDHCYLSGVPLETFPEPRLQQCEAMNGQQNCQRCGCPWNSHMHITYMHESVEIKIEDITTKSHIRNEQEKIRKAEDIVKQLSDLCMEYGNEEKMLLKASAEFGSFLKHNAILPYNDALKEYLNHMISEEKQKQSNTNTESKTLKGLEQSLKEYNEEVRILEEAMKMSTSKPKSPAEIKRLIEDLYKLKHFGSKVREGLEANSAGQFVELKANEVAIRIQPKRHRTLFERGVDYIGNKVFGSKRPKGLQGYNFS